MYLLYVYLLAHYSHNRQQCISIYLKIMVSLSPFSLVSSATSFQPHVPFSCLLTFRPFISVITSKPPNVTLYCLHFCITIVLQEHGFTIVYSFHPVFLSIITYITSILLRIHKTLERHSVSFHINDNIHRIFLSSSPIISHFKLSTIRNMNET